MATPQNDTDVLVVHTPVVAIPLQGSATQPLALLLQRPDDGHASAALQARQPPASARHVWTRVPEHLVVPACEQVLLHVDPPPPPPQALRTNADAKPTAHVRGAIRIPPCTASARAAEIRSEATTVGGSRVGPRTAEVRALPWH